jgi:hypothetical protein
MAKSGNACGKAVPAFRRRASDDARRRHAGYELIGFRLTQVK